MEARLRYWSKDEISSVFKAAEQADPQFKIYMLWAFYSAMRRSEILNIEWKDVITLPDGGIKIHIPISKSDKSRQIPCNKQMIDLLQSLKVSAGKEQNKIFRFSPKTIQRRIDEVRKICGVPDIRLHDLRTLNITSSLISGVDPKTLTGITGHADLQMIQKHYSVVVNEELVKASDRSGNYIESILT
ncbi:MAG: hypothetical protein DI626_12050 [Micavibrio aeruginosavorus]|uniref:Tyr recombinase domain-containing protein n=1 Tax=Micavibrio aeruginosavorus TaxID=349221 RepID=A0A2W4Z9Y2_9BACT|nr:MAG: hypothetical protein DI626_12050 [Micavibrio aeruginosavorus]